MCVQLLYCVYVCCAWVQKKKQSIAISSLPPQHVPSSLTDRGLIYTSLCTESQAGVAAAYSFCHSPTVGMFCSQIDCKTLDASLCCSCVCYLMQLATSPDFLNVGYYLGWSTTLALPLGANTRKETKVTFFCSVGLIWLNYRGDSFSRVKNGIVPIGIH